ncbi:hypothetical protein BDQ12DRAFT_432311 [Crucibulum laeve]|uniref:Uncharacterized protein n=1 Tax=Crucibulum laeve TaxID=68775 RepID=A0A5C3M995_9AGAR|nr:hypothetical protein BDQ12DRAFT_432311 [Crucibulum laeve]
MPTDDTVNNADPAQVAAATLIQRLWRGRTNHAKDEYMTPDLRWDDAAVNAKLAVVRAAASEGKNSPRQRWKRAAFLAVRLQDGNEMIGDSSDAQGINAEDKQLEAQHWLELVDGKHRYGSNLKVILIRLYVIGIVSRSSAFF